MSQGNEFKILSDNLSRSGCAKKQIGAATYSDCELIIAFNSCDFEGDICPRLNLPTGVGYDLCSASHAEAKLAEHMKSAGLISDGIAWVFGHYYACEPCATALKSVGVREIRVREVAA